YEITHFLGPGEIVRIRPDGMEQLRRPNKKMQICSFLWVYYGFPTSCYENRNVEEVRHECGRLMGEQDTTEVDCACGIPDSGIGMAVGYANGHKVPYQRAVSKYTPTWPRSFMPANPNLRSLVAKMKLIPNKEVLNGKRVLFCDDSIVRGNQLKDKTVALRELGAKEIHMRIACPPLVYGCPFINFAASKTELELITRQIIQDIEGDMNKNVEAYTQTDSPEYKCMVSEIAKRLSLDSLMFSKLETLVQAIGLPKCQLCTHCFDGSSAHTIKGQLE
ncbi:MAG: amidophosphoribosyltransferase, partial [Bacteroidaceae bacterium]|nr:amidophosphoribosyltransferase [Bacteroidaceae bacterium]